MGKLALVLLSLAALVFGVAACGEEETVEQQATATAASGTASPTPEGSPAASPSPDGVPGDWKTYDDPALGFSLRYPKDLEVEDITQPNPNEGVAERAVQFRSATDQRRSLLISVSSNPKGLALENWAVMFAACNPKSTQPATLNAQEAISCDRQVLGPPEPSVLAERSGKIFLLTAGEALGQSEFESVIRSFRF